MFKVECQCKQDCCVVVVNLAALTYCGYYQILNVGDSLSDVCLIGFFAFSVTTLCHPSAPD